MNLRELLSVFIIEESNFNILHWNCHGNKFDRMHTLAEEWYERCAKNKDAVAEMAMRIGLDPVSYLETFAVLKNTDIDYKILTHDDKFDHDNFMKEVQEIIGQICASILAVLDSEDIKKPENVGIKSTLEGIYEEWDLDLRYKNPHRM